MAPVTKTVSSSLFFPKQDGPPTIMGCDPGASGGFAWLSDGKIETAPMPGTEGDLRDWLNEFFMMTNNVIVFIEDLPYFVPMPSQVSVTRQVSTASKLFGNFGFIKGFVMARGATLRTVKPQTWQRDLNIGTKSGKTSKKWKHQLKNEAQKRFPKQKVTLKNADALLILEWGVRHL